MNRKRLSNLLKIFLVVAILVIGCKLVPYMNPGAVRGWVDSFGSLGPIIYIALWSILPVFLFPVPALALPGGILFGFLEGCLYTLIGVSINTTIMFVMSRYLFKDQIKDFLYDRMPESVTSRLYLKDQKSLWIFFFILRFLPIVSYNLINYAAGLTEIKYKNQMTSTILGVLPGTIAYINFGDKMLNPRSKDFALAIGLVILIVLASLIVAKIFMPEEEGAPARDGQGESDHNSTDL